MHILLFMIMKILVIGALYHYTFTSYDNLAIEAL